MNVSEIYYYINRHNQQHAAEHRTHDITLWILHLFAEVNHSVPAIVGIKHSLQGNDERGKKRKALRDGSLNSGIRFSGNGESSDRNGGEDQCLYRAGQVLSEAAPTNPTPLQGCE